VRERLGTAVRDLVFHRAVVNVPTLSVGHYREMMERTAGPVIKLVETLQKSDPAKLAAFRKDFDAVASEYFDENILQQGYLMTRATKV